MIPKKKFDSGKDVQKKKKVKADKPSIHSRNRYSGKYDFSILSELVPELKPLIVKNENEGQTINFFDPKSVVLLNKALLSDFYEVTTWDIPKGYLCPPVPGRADYIHHVADLLQKNNFGTIPTGSGINVLDVGVGANGIYSIISALEYGWSAVGVDIDPIAIEAFGKTIDANEELKDLVSLRLQENANHMFSGAINLKEKYDLVVCNPPFHSSLKEANKGTLRKLRSLKKENVKKPVRNFEGMSNELWCEGGEIKFITDMVNQSIDFSTQVFWFTTLVSKHSNLRAIHKLLRSTNATKVETIEMGQGNKSSRIVAWTFLTKEQQQVWRAERWRPTEF